jgi:hypothetical protein
MAEQPKDITQQEEDKKCTLLVIQAKIGGMTYRVMKAQVTQNPRKKKSKKQNKNRRLQLSKKPNKKS